MYLGDKEIISSDNSIIATSIGMDCHMDAAEFEGLLYTTLSENPLKNHRVNIKTVKMILLYLIIFLSILE